MKNGYSLRIPILTGASCASELVRLGISAFPLFLFAVLFLFHTDTWMAAELGRFFKEYFFVFNLFMGPVVPIILVVVSCFHFANIVRGLPSDLLIDVGRGGVSRRHRRSGVSGHGHPLKE